VNRDHSELERDQSEFSSDGGGREGIRKSESVSERDLRDGRRVIKGEKMEGLDLFVSENDFIVFFDYAV